MPGEDSFQDFWDKMRPREAYLRKFALTLLQQCKDENLTMDELESVIDSVKYYAAKTTLRDGLIL